MRKERIVGIGAVAAGAILVLSNTAAGCNIRVEIPGSDWSARVGMSLGDKDKLKEPIEDYANRDIEQRDNFINLNPEGHVGPFGILASAAVGEEPKGSPFNQSINIER